MSSDDETYKAMPKIDKEELRKYIRNSDDESSQNKTSPQKSKRVLHKIKTSPQKSKRVLHKIKPSSQDKPKKLIPKDSPQKYLLQGDDFKRLQKKAKKLGARSLDVSQRKKNKWLNTTAKRFTSVLPTLKTSLLTKTQFVETSISQRPRKFQTKMVN